MRRKIGTKQANTATPPSSLPFRETARYFLRALRLLARQSPVYFLYRVLLSPMQAAVNFCVNALLLRWLLNSAESAAKSGDTAAFGRTVLLTVLIYFGNFLFQGLLSYLSLTLRRRGETVCRLGVTKLLLQKARDADLAAFEDPAFYDRYLKAMESAGVAFPEVLNELSTLLSLGTSFLLGGSLLFTMNPLFLLFLLLPLLFSIFEKKGAELDYRVNAEDIPIRREQTAIKRCFFLTDYAKEMRLTRMPELLRDRFHALSLRHAELLRKYGAKRTFFGFLVNGVEYFLTRIGGFLFAIYQVTIAGGLALGDCAVAISTLVNAQSKISRFTGVYAAVAGNALSLRDAFGFLSYTPKIRDEGDRIAHPGVIRFENVSFSYPVAGTDGTSGTKVLDRLSFTMEPGRKLALVGLNGAGKSTVVKLLLRLYDPTEGRITLDGVDIREFSLSSYRRLFFALPQQFHLFALSLGEMVAGREVTTEDSSALWDALDLAGMKERVKKIPEGLSARLTKEFDPAGEVFSGGEGQKLRLASLYFDRAAAFCLLDEPSSALDVRSELRLFENLRDAAGERGVLFISHRLSAAYEADEILLLEGGRLAARGTHRELLRESPRYREMFMAQAEKYGEWSVQNRA